MVARALAGEGYALLLVDVDGDGLEAVASALTGPGTTAVCDVAEPGEVERALDLAPSPRVLVQCAGIIRPDELLDVRIEDWWAVLRVNLTGTFVVGRAAAARMKKSGGGTIVNVASIGGIVPGYRHGAYSASKAAVMTLTEQMALEWAPYGIRVNAVAPGMIDAGMGASINADAERRRRRDAMIPIGRQGTAEDVAGAVVYLASERAAYVTGHTLVIDGGLTKSLLGRR